MSNPPAARRLSRGEAAAQTRDRLLAAGREVFLRRGYQAASIYEIAEVAGYSIGALYSHFGGKDGLFIELLDRHFDEQLDRFASDLAARPDERGAPAHGGDFWTRLLDRDRDLVVLFIEFWSVAMRDPELKSRLAASYRKLRDALARFIADQEKQSGVGLAASPTEAAIVFDALVDGFALHKLADPGGVPDGLIARALGWMAAGMAAEPGVGRQRAPRTCRRAAEP